MESSSKSSQTLSIFRHLVSSPPSPGTTESYLQWVWQVAFPARSQKCSLNIKQKLIINFEEEVLIPTEFVKETLTTLGS